MRMMEKQNLVGQRFGKLIVLTSAPPKHGRARWACQCDCGTLCATSGKNLRAGKKKSCGCLRREICTLRAALNSENNKLPSGQAAFNLLYANYRYHAQERDFAFELSKDYFRELTQQICFYCGVPPGQRYETPAKTGGYVYNGLDRKDNKLGYTKENTVPCCGICNDMKRSRSVEVFLAACTAIITHQNHKK